MKIIRHLLLIIITLLTVFSGTSTTKDVFAVENNNTVYPDALIMTMINLNADGDSTLITYNNVNILIDAGGVVKSSHYIYDKIKNLDKLDYVIMTHGDQDHIINFSNKEDSAIHKWFNDDKKHYIGTLIDFDISQDKTVTSYNKKLMQSLFMTKKYNNYASYRKQLLEEGRINNYFTASQCVWKERGLSNAPVENAKSFFQLDSNPNNGIRILYNYFYDHQIYDRGVAQACEKNILSVCTLITVDDKKLLFTGDIEEFDSGKTIDYDPKEYEEVEVIENDPNSKSYSRIYGESYLVALNYEYLKDGVTFYKAAHHGSRTSNSANLLDVIRPKYIGISCAATDLDMKIGEQFPHDVALNNMSKWTDYIYLTSHCIDSKNKAELYGDIIYTYNKDPLNEEEIFTSSVLANETNSRGETSFLDEWFLKNRFISFNVYTLGQTEGLNIEIDDTNSKELIHNKHSDNLSLIESIFNNNQKDKEINLSNTTFNCTYIKIGHIDILINFGTDVDATSNLPKNKEKIEKLCNDGVLDYLILSNYNNESTRGLIGNNGLLKSTEINEIKNFISFRPEGLNFQAATTKIINEIDNSLLIKKSIKHDSTKLNNINILTGDINSQKESNLLDISLNFYNLYDVIKDKYQNINNEDDRVYSLMFDLTMKKDDYVYKYYNFGYIKDDDMYEHLLNSKFNITSSNKNVNFVTIEMPSNGRLSHKETSKNPNQDKLLKTIGNTATVLYNGFFESHTDVMVGNNLFSRKRTPNLYSTSLNRNEKKVDIVGNIVNRIEIGSRVTSIIYGTKTFNYLTPNSSSAQVDKQKLDTIWNTL